MRAITLGLAAATLVAGAALVSTPAAAESGFDIRGTWAADGRACQDAASFVEFDGRDVLGFAPGTARTRVAADYSVASEEGRVVVSLTDLGSQDRDRLVFLVGGADAIQLDNSFVSVTLTRCTGRSQQLAAQP